MIFQQTNKCKNFHVEFTLTKQINLFCANVPFWFPLITSQTLGSFTFGSLVFSALIKREHWPKMG